MAFSPAGTHWGLETTAVTKDPSKAGGRGALVSRDCVGPVLNAALRRYARVHLM